MCAHRLSNSILYFFDSSDITSPHKTMSPIFKVGKRCGLVKDGNYAMGSRPSQQCASGETRPDTQKLDNSWASNHQIGGGRRLSVEDSNHGRRLRMVCGLQSNGQCVSGLHPHIYCASGESERTNNIRCWSGWGCVKCRKRDTCHPETEAKVCKNVYPFNTYTISEGGGMGGRRLAKRETCATLNITSSFIYKVK